MGITNIFTLYYVFKHNSMNEDNLTKIMINFFDAGFIPVGFTPDKRYSLAEKEFIVEGFKNRIKSAYSKLEYSSLMLTLDGVEVYFSKKIIDNIDNDIIKIEVPNNLFITDSSNSTEINEEKVAKLRSAFLVFTEKIISEFEGVLVEAIGDFYLLSEEYGKIKPHSFEERLGKSWFNVIKENHAPTHFVSFSSTVNKKLNWFLNKKVKSFRILIGTSTPENAKWSF